MLRGTKLSVHSALMGSSRGGDSAWCREDVFDFSVFCASLEPSGVSIGDRLSKEAMSYFMPIFATSDLA